MANSAERTCWLRRFAAKGASAVGCRELMKIISCKLLKNKQTMVPRSEEQPPQPDGHRSLAREKT